MAVRPSVGWKQTGKKKRPASSTISIWRGEKAGPVLTAVKWSGARLTVIFLQVSLPHTSTMCSALAPAGRAGPPGLWRLYPLPQIYIHFSLPRWRREKPHMFSFLPFLGWADCLRMNHLPPRRSLVFHLAPWPGGYGPWGSMQWKTSLRGNASWNRQTAIPSACAVPAASWRTGISSEKILGKAKSKSNEEREECWRSRGCSGLGHLS